MPALRSPLRPAIRSALRSPFAPSSGASGGAPALNVIQQFIAAGKNAVYFEGVGTGTTTVNSDGTGGEPGIDGIFGRLIDLGGTQNCHAVQATTNIQPTKGIDCAAFAQRDWPVYGNNLVRHVTTAAAPLGDTQNCTFAFIADCNSLPIDMLPSASITCVARTLSTSTNTLYPVGKVCVVGRMRASGVEVRVNNTVYTQGAIAVAALRAIRIGAHSVNNLLQNDVPAFKCAVYFNTGFNDTDFNTLHTYFMQRSGASTLGNGSFVVMSDSILQGVRTQGRWGVRLLAEQWPHPVYNFARAGTGWVLNDSIYTHEICRKAKGSDLANNQIHFQQGINDGGQIGSGADVELIQRGNCRTAERLGYKTSTGSTVYLSGSSLAFATAFNVPLKANNAQYSDGFVDLLAQVGWSGDIHYNDADNVIWLGAALTVFESIRTKPVVRFNRSVIDAATSLTTDLTDISEHSPTSWAWTLPGGSPSSSTAQNPTGVSYAAPGENTITLAATNAFGTGTRVLPNAINVQDSPLAPSLVGRVGWFKRNTGISASAWINQDSALPFILLTEGSGYTDGTYNIVFSGGGGTGAAGTYTCLRGRVVSLARTVIGVGYSTAPTMAFTNGGGSGATAKAFINTGVLVDVPTFNFNQATGLNQPTVTANGTWLFDGTNSYAVSDSLSTLALPADYVIMARFKLVTHVNNRVIFEGATANHSFQTSTVSGRLVSTSFGTQADIDGVALNAWQTLHFGFLSGNSASHRITALELDDGGLLVNRWFNGSSAPTAIYLGANASAGSKSNIELAELIITYNPVTDRVRAQNRAYLRTAI